MAPINVHNSTVGIVQGVTWGTAVQAVKRLRVQSLVINDSTDIRKTANHDVSFFAGKIKQGVRNVTGTITVDCNLGGEWLLLYAIFAGTASVPAEQTVSQGDYLHNLDFATDSTKFFCLAFEGESDVVYQINSCKISSVTLSGVHNGALTFTCQFTGDRMVNTGAATTNAQLDALTFQMTEDPTIFNGANTYVRLKDYSTGVSLSASHDVPAVNFDISLTKPISPRHAIRGANTQYTYEPHNSGLGEGKVKLTLVEINDATIDLFNKYANATYLMMEIFTDGAQIASGVNASLKMQIPYMIPLNAGGFGIPSQAAIAQPMLDMEMGSAPAAASGMSGFTRAMRLVTIDSRSTAYLS